MMSKRRKEGRRKFSETMIMSERRKEGRKKFSETMMMTGKRTEQFSGFFNRTKNMGWQ